MKEGVEGKKWAKWKGKEKTKPWFISRIFQVRYIHYWSQELIKNN